MLIRIRFNLGVGPVTRLPQTDRVGTTVLEDGRASQHRLWRHGGCAPPGALAMEARTRADVVPVREIRTPAEGEPRYNESAYHLPTPEGARRWAEAAGAAVAEWFIPDQLAAPETHDRASEQLKKAAFAYAGSRDHRLQPGSGNGSDVPYQIHAVALEAFEAAAQRGSDAIWRAALRGDVPALPVGTPRERMEAAALAVQFDVSDAAILGRPEEGEEQVDDFLDTHVRVRILERAWFVLTSRSTSFDVSATRHALKAGTGQWAVATFAPWEQATVDPLVGRLTELAKFGRDGLEAAIAARRALLAGARVGPRPDPQPYGVSPEGAEHLAAAWMTYLGATGVQVTRASRDGGIDVCSDKYVAQVKAWNGPVGAVDVRALVGVAAVDHRIPLFFATTGYTADALAFAQLAELPLFVMDPVVGTLDPVTPSAVALRRGLA